MNSPRHEPTEMRLICWEPGLVADGTVQAGGKARSLAMAQANGLPVPRWCVILPQAFSDAGVLASSVVETLPSVLETHLQGAAWFAVRSSAIQEDGTHYSFAGMLDSFLFVAPHQVAQKVAAVWQSAFTPRVIAYCREHGLDPTAMVPAVIIQEMVEAEKSGVAFSADPVSGSRNLAVVSAAWGLGSGLVSGECESDTYTVNPLGEVVQQKIALKTSYHHGVTNGLNERTVSTEPVSTEKQSQSVLLPGEIQSVVHLTRQARALFGSEQDIEWSFAKGRLYLLQSRPITHLPPPPSHPERWHYWDNSLTIESWPGVNTPFTCALAQRLQTATYSVLTRWTCRPKVPEATYELLCAELVAARRGRLYLDQRMLQTLWMQTPSLVYRVDDGWRETLGLWRRLVGAASGTYSGPIYHSEVLALARQWGGTAKGLLQLAWYYRQLPREIHALERHLAPLLLPARGGSLGGLWHSLEGLLNVLGQHWHAPTLNTYFANRLLEGLQALDPAGYGLAEVERKHGTSHPPLSQQFQQQLADLAQQAKQHPSLLKALEKESLGSIQAMLTEFPQVAGSLERLLAQFGERCQADAKMESIPWSENPLPLLRMVGLMARSPQEPTSFESPTRDTALRPTGLKGWLGKVLAQHYYQRVHDREALRLLMTRTHGAIRRHILAIGVLLSHQGRLAEPRDVLFLLPEEVESLIRLKNSLEAELKATIEHRKNDYHQCLASPAPPDAFEAWGPLIPEEEAIAPKTLGEVQTLTAIGQACSPGQVTAHVVWLSEDLEVSAYQGKILVAPYGDPGLVNYYPVICGLLLVRGSVLSHPAIVARELGIPTIVGLPGLSDWLENGETITMDGNTGQIIRQPAPTD